MAAESPAIPAPTIPILSGLLLAIMAVSFCAYWFVEVDRMRPGRHTRLRQSVVLLAFRYLSLLASMAPRIKVSRMWQIGPVPWSRLNDHASAEQGLHWNKATRRIIAALVGRCRMSGNVILRWPNSPSYQRRTSNGLPKDEDSG